MKDLGKKLGVIAMMFALSITHVNAQDAMTISTNYGEGDINGSALATYVGDKFASMGYNSGVATLTNPTVVANRINYYNQSNSSSGVFFFYGHSSKDAVGWLSNKDYSTQTGIYKNGATGFPSTYYPVTNINLSGTKMGVFLGCNSAQSTDNITKYAQTKGAKVTTGWVYEIYNGDAHYWTSYFFEKLSTGSTFKEAYKYANSFSYLSDERMKTHRVYGDSSVKIKLSNSNAVSSEITSQNDLDSSSIDKREVTSFKLNEKVDTLEQIKERIKTKFDNNFDINNYSLSIADGPDGSIYSFSYMYNDVKTLHGYTAMIEKNVVEIYNNMDNIKEDLNNVTSCSTFNINNQKDVNEYVEELINKYSDYRTEATLKSIIKTYNDELHRVVLNINIKLYDKETKTSFIKTEII